MWLSDMFVTNSLNTCLYEVYFKDVNCQENFKKYIILLKRNFLNV